MVVITDRYISYFIQLGHVEDFGFHLVIAMLTSKLPKVFLAATGYNQGDVILHQPCSKGFADAGGGSDDEDFVVVEHAIDQEMKRLKDITLPGGELRPLYV